MSEFFSNDVTAVFSWLFVIVNSHKHVQTTKKIHQGGIFMVVAIYMNACYTMLITREVHREEIPLAQF